MIPSRPFSDTPTVLLKNIGDEEIPPRSFVKITEGELLANGTEVLKCTIPDGSNNSIYMVTGHVPIPVGKVRGGFNPTHLTWVSVSSSVEPSSEIGPVSDDWQGSTSGTGFIVVRVDGTRCLIWKKPTGSGTPIIRFAIVSSDPVTREALALVLSRPTDGYVPEIQFGGLHVTVCDPAGCFLNEPNVELTGRQGFAAYVYPLEEVVCSHGGYNEAHWEVFSICCNTNICPEA